MGQGSSKNGSFAEGIPIIAPPQGQLGAIPNYIDQRQARTWIFSSTRPARLTVRAEAATTSSQQGVEYDSDTDYEDDEDLKKPLDGPSPSKESGDKKKKHSTEARKYFVSNPSTGAVVFTLRRRSHKFVEDIVVADAEGHLLYRAVQKHGWKAAWGTFYAYAYNEEARRADPNAKGKKERKQGREYLKDLAEDEANKTMGANASFTVTVRWRGRLKVNIGAAAVSRGASSDSKLGADDKLSFKSPAASEKIHMQLRTMRGRQIDGVLMMQQNGEQVMTKKERKQAAEEGSLRAQQQAASGGSGSAAAVAADRDDDAGKGKKHWWSSKGKESDDEEDAEDEEAIQSQSLGGQPLLKLGTVQTRKSTGFINRTFSPSWDFTVAPGIDPTMVATAMVVGQVVIEQLGASTTSAASAGTSAAVVAI